MFIVDKHMQETLDLPLSKSHTQYVFEVTKKIRREQVLLLLGCLEERLKAAGENSQDFGVLGRLQFGNEGSEQVVDDDHKFLFINLYLIVIIIFFLFFLLRSGTFLILTLELLFILPLALSYQIVLIEYIH